MNPNDWLLYKQPGFADLSEDERNAIRDFVFLWSLFEANVLDINASARAIVTAARRWSEGGLIAQETFEAEQAYFRNRYCRDGQFSNHFDHLHLREGDNEELVRKFLKRECRHAWEDAAGLLIVVYRLRNNLFHGLKWAYAIQGQRENFNNANSALARSIDLGSLAHD